MEELWSSQCLFYSMSETYTNFAQFRNRLDEKIDRDILQRALDTTMCRYPYFKVKLMRRGEELVLVENEEPMLVYDDADAPTMEPAQNHNQLIRVSAAGDVFPADRVFCAISAMRSRPATGRKLITTKSATNGTSCPRTRSPAPRRCGCSAKRSRAFTGLAPRHA